MIEPWFNPNMYAWLPGTLLGVLGGVEGTIAGTLAPQGKHRRLVFGIHFGAIGISAMLLIVGVIALGSGQPYGIWYGFGFPGLLGVALFGSLTPFLRRRYREAELRKSVAQDL